MDGPLWTLPRGGACLRCRRNKRKCDAAKPACGGCTKSGHVSECEYQRPPTRDVATEAPAYKIIRWGLAVNANKIAPEVPLVDHSLEWWKSDQVPPTITDFLTIIFLNHTSQVQMEELAPSIISRISHFPPSHPSYPHPCLLNAMYLVAAFYLSSSSHPARIERRVRWDPASVEAYLLKKARRLMDSSMSKPENLVDVLLSMNIIARYFLASLRYIEGWDEAASSTRLAIHCNLHKITSPNIAQYPPSVLPAPATSLELRDRLNLFWMAYTTDRSRSLHYQTQVTLHDEEVTTIFPQPMDEYSLDKQSISSSIWISGSNIADVSGDSLHIVKTKVSAFLEIVRQVTIKVKEEGAMRLKDTSPALHREFCATESSLRTLISTIPTHAAASSSSSNNVTFESEYALVAVLRALPRATIIRLHAPFLGHDAQSRARVLAIAKEIVAIARELEPTREIYWQTPINIVWNNACEALQQESSRILSQKEVQPEERRMVLEMRRDMEFLATCSARFLKVYRFHQSATTNFIEYLLAQDSEAIVKLIATTQV